MTPKKIINPNLIFVTASLLVLRLVLIKPSLAVCPVCTVAVAGGLGLSRWLGIDDAITGVWIGGLIVSTGLWLANWLAKNPKFKLKISKPALNATAVILTFILVVVPLIFGGVIGHPLNTILGIDKLIFGSVLGLFAFLASVWLDQKLRKIFKRQLLNYQKVILPIGILAIISLTLYLVL